MTETSQVPAQAITERFARVQERIEAACRRAGRRPDEITLIAVSKTFPLAAIEAARRAGLRHFGENKAQELVSKAEQLPGLVAGGELCWHMIGHLQRNKARDVVQHADLFHALDSLRLAETLERRAAQDGRVMPCLVQVNVSGEESKFGLEPEQLPEFLETVSRYEHLRLRGLMTLAAPAEDPEQVRPQFRLLRTLSKTHAGRVVHGRFDWLSMGMSSDFEVAIEEGATHIRLGTALFGDRDYGSTP